MYNFRFGKLWDEFDNILPILDYIIYLTVRMFSFMMVQTDDKNKAWDENLADPVRNLPLNMFRI